MKTINPKEFKVMALRDCPVPSDMLVCETPQQIVDYWHLHIATTPHFNPECECLAVFMLNTRNRVKGHQMLTIGTPSFNSQKGDRAISRRNNTEITKP